MTYDWKLTLKKVGATLAIYGIPAFLSWAQDNNIIWALSFSTGLLWLVDYLKHK